LSFSVRIGIMKRCRFLLSCSMVSFVLATGEVRASTGAVGAAEGWVAVSPREEIRPAFSFKKDGGPKGRGSLVISDDEREGLDGCWRKTFPIKGGAYYRFRVVRRVEAVPSPRRSAVARILWRDADGRPVHHDEAGA